MIAKWLPLLSGTVLLSGCVITNNPATGPTQYDSPSFERGDVKELRLTLDMGAGDLKVGTGTHKLAQAYFTYNVPSWKPEVDFNSSGGSASLVIRQNGTHHAHFGTLKYEWDLRLNQEVPLDLKVNFGAGQAQLDLGSLDLRSVAVDMGVGSLRMDLRGNPKHDYNVRVNGGVGEAVLQLPGNVGVYAEASGGIGEISARNLRKEGDHYVNDLVGKSPVTVRINVQGGVGSIQLIGE